MFPSLNSPEKIVNLFDALTKHQVPEKFTVRFLASLGFKSSQDREFIQFLKFMNLLTLAGVPTAYYFKLRSAKDFKEVLQGLIHKSYLQVFAFDTKIPFVPEDELKSYFVQLSSVADFEVNKMLATFMTLCTLAGFEEPTVLPGSDYVASTTQVTEREVAKPTIKLSINLPTTTDPKVYEVIFKYLRDLL